MALARNLDPVSSRTPVWSRVDLDDEDPARTRLTESAIRELANACGGSRVSIYLPTHERGGRVQQDPLSFGALLRAAANGLEVRGLSRRRIAEFLAPAHALRRDMNFWNHGRRGLGVLVSPSDMHVFKLPDAVDPVCMVDGRFRVAPLVPLTRDDRFAVLALGRARVRLYEGGRDRLDALPLGDIPSELEAVTGDQPAGASLQWHTRAASPTGTGRRPATFHGHGAGHDDREHELTTFMRHIVAALPAQLPHPDAPLVLASVERNVAQFRRCASLPNITTDAVVGYPEDMDVAQLHASAWRCAEPAIEGPYRRARARIAELYGTERVATDLGAVLRSARAGRVAVLLAAAGARAWGEFDPVDSRMELHEARHPDDDELVDLSIAYALGGGASVQIVDADTLPPGALVAAQLRY